MPRTGLSAEEIREKAIDVAESKMSQLGFERVRLVDIARELGVSHVALYKHFPDKAALFDAVSERWLTEMDSRLEGLLKGGEPAIERLTEWFVEFHKLKREKVLREPELYSAFNHASASMKPFIVRHMSNVESQVTKLVEQAIQEGSLKAETPRSVSRLLLELTIGYHHPRLVAERSGQNREDDLRSSLSVILRAFLPSDVT